MRTLASLSGGLAPWLVSGSMILGLAACGDDVSPTDNDAAPGVADAAPDQPDADPNRPDAAPGAPDAAPGAPDAMPQPGGNMFSQQTLEDARNHGQGSELVDMDRDGDLDVVVAFSRDDSVILYINESDGDAWTEVPIAPPDTIVAMDVAARDFDGDGDLDVAAIALFDRAAAFASPGEVTWFENPGTLTGTWTPHPIDDALWGARSLASADLNGDALPDLVVACIRINSMGDGVYWFRNTGGGFAGPLAVDADLSQATSVQVADIDADQQPDIVATSFYGSQVAWYRNGGQGGDATAFTGHTIARPRDPHSAYPANLDADPALEVVVAHKEGLVWYDPPADPTQEWTEQPIAAAPSPDNASDTAVHVAELSGDGVPDVAVSARPSQRVRVYLRDGDGWTERNVADGYAASFVNAGDINRDGRTDLVTSSYDNAGGDRVLWWQNGE